MLKQTVTYYDFDDNESQETLYFNLTKAELADNLYLQTELEELQEIFKGKQRDLEVPEIQRIIDLVKTLMRLSYGIRSEDGKRFIKSEEQWVEFTQTAVYDTFLYSMFEDASKAVEFMTGILPKDLRAEAQKMVDTGVHSISKVPESTLTEVKSDGNDISQLSPEQMEAAAKAWAEKNQ